MTARGAVARATPPSGFEERGRWPVRSLTDLHRLRADVRRAAVAAVGDPETGAAARRLAHVLLAATELASNAVRHGGQPTEVHLSSRDGALLLVVEDHEPGRAPRQVRDVGGPVDAAMVGGRGILVVRSVASAVHWSVSGDRKQVWALFDAA